MRVFLQDFALVSTSAHGDIREDTIEVSSYANFVPHGAELGKRSGVDLNYAAQDSSHSLIGTCKNMGLVLIKFVI